MLSGVDLGLRSGGAEQVLGVVQVLLPRPRRQLAGVVVTPWPRSLLPIDDAGPDGLNSDAYVDDSVGILRMPAFQLAFTFAFDRVLRLHSH